VFETNQTLAGILNAFAALVASRLADASLNALPTIPLRSLTIMYGRLFFAVWFLWVLIGVVSVSPFTLPAS
jgi:hypothetical protein